MTVAVEVLLAYLLGSVSGSLLFGKLKGVDIRTMGSGNAGGTNALRTQGLLFAIGVVLVDVGKGTLAVALVAGSFSEPWAWTPLLCGFAAVFGHCYPVWHGFRGGKGAATAVGTLLAINAWLLVPMLSTWIIVLFFSGYVGLATVASGFALAPSAWMQEAPAPIVIYCLALALFMAFTHRSNFRNLAAGTENRARRFWIGRFIGRKTS